MSLHDALSSNSSLPIRMHYGVYYINETVTVPFGTTLEGILQYFLHCDSLCMQGNWNGDEGTPWKKVLGNSTLQTVWKISPSLEVLNSIGHYIGKELILTLTIDVFKE
jgi:hypothetical protein